MPIKLLCCYVLVIIVQHSPENIKFGKIALTESTDLIEANCHARLNCLKQLLNDVTFIWFSDKKLSH